jgi:hypothetical protein
MTVNGLAQNLVPNPSFEDTVSCPYGSENLDDALDWINCSSADYFNVCANPFDSGVPNNFGGYQMPASGNAYAGLITYATISPNYREYAACNLTSPLTIGIKYYVSFKVALAIENVYNPANCASDKIGAMFTTYFYDCDTLVESPFISNNPPVFTDSIITDTLNWTRITGSFVADSAYTYFIIGNFFDDANTDTTKFFTSFSTYDLSYYFIDDVCVGTDSSFVYNYSYATAITENYLNSQFSLYPNPANDFVNIQNNLQVPFNIHISNTLGQQLYSEQNITSNHLQLNISNYSSGLLFITITSDKNQFTYKLLKH